MARRLIQPASAACMQSMQVGAVAGQSSPVCTTATPNPCVMAGTHGVHTHPCDAPPPPHIMSPGREAGGKGGGSASACAAEVNHGPVGTKGGGRRMTHLSMSGQGQLG